MRLGERTTEPRSAASRRAAIVAAWTREERVRRRRTAESRVARLAAELFPAEKLAARRPRHA